MVSQYRHRRTSDPAIPFATLEPGEVAVNTANRQLAVGDAATGSIGAPLALIALRFFDPRAQYVAGDLVVQAGVVYRAKASIPPGAFSSAQWDMLVGTVDTQYVAKAGDTMSGLLTLSGAPTAGGHAATKTYVDNLIATKVSVYVSDTPPSGAPDNSLWWEGDSGQLFLRYNDGDSTAWVVAVPQPDTASFVIKAGDTLTGALNVNMVDPRVRLNKTAATQANGVGGQLNGVYRWMVNLGNGVAETGANAGSHFEVTRFSDAGAGIDVPISVDRSTGNFTTSVKGFQPGGGSWSAISDARIKTVLGDYASGLEQVLALRPIRYTYKGNDTLIEPALAIGRDEKTPVTVPYDNSAHRTPAIAATEFIGLIAQDAETVMPEMVTQVDGYIDGMAVTDLRHLDTTPLIFALINAVKELQAMLNARL